MSKPLQGIHRDSEIDAIETNIATARESIGNLFKIGGLSIACGSALLDLDQTLLDGLHAVEALQRELGPKFRIES